MAIFSKPAKQAKDVIKRIQGSIVKSSGSVRSYEDRLRIICQHFKEAHAEALVEITPNRALEYLYDRALEVSQSTLNMERLALELMMHEVSCVLPRNKKLPYIKSMKDEVLKSRSYTPYQVFRVCSAQKEANAFSTKLAFFAGLRAHELLTILPISEQPPSPRPAHTHKFLKRGTWIRYTVIGKGGLIREVRLPPSLSKRLEERRLAEPRKVVDRRVNYTQHYDLKAGINFSSSFSSASKRSLGWSNGAHGARHSYAQLRMTELRTNGVDRNTALRVVSQELGHFRPSITLVYLR